MLSSIPGNSFDLLIANSQAVLAVFGHLKYSHDLQILYTDSRQVDMRMRMYSSTRSPTSPYASILIATVASFFKWN
jgi:hypothetical protein